MRLLSETAINLLPTLLASRRAKEDLERVLRGQINRIIKIRVYDIGYRLGIALFGKWAISIQLLFPLSRKTIRYSLKHQGVWKSFQNRFWVSRSDKAAKEESPEKILSKFETASDHKVQDRWGV